MAEPILTVCHDLGSIYQETIEALEEALEHSKNLEFDGAIILLTKRDKPMPTVLRAGRMRHAGNALLQVERLKLRLVSDTNNN